MAKRKQSTEGRIKYQEVENVVAGKWWKILIIYSAIISTMVLAFIIGMLIAINLYG